MNQIAPDEDRSANLNMFVQGGIVETVEQLNRMDKTEYENLLEILMNSNNDIPASFDENELKFDDDFVVLQMPLEERIKKLKTKLENKVPANDHIKEGRCRFEDFLLWYEATEKLQIGAPFRNRY